MMTGDMRGWGIGDVDGSKGGKDSLSPGDEV